MIATHATAAAIMIARPIVFPCCGFSVAMATPSAPDSPSKHRSCQQTPRPGDPKIRLDEAAPREILDGAVFGSLPGRSHMIAALLAAGAVEICAADPNMAHKVAENIRLANVALVANLSALR